MNADTQGNEGGASEKPQPQEQVGGNQVATLKLALRTYEQEKLLAKVIARNIKHKRQKAGMTQSELALLTRKKQPDIARQERSSYGRHTIHSLNKLAVALGTTVSDLVTMNFDAEMDVANPPEELTTQLDSILNDLAEWCIINAEDMIEDAKFINAKVAEARTAILALIAREKLKAIEELKRRWHEDRKTMDYSPDTYDFICDKYIAELRKELE